MDSGSSGSMQSSSCGEEEFDSSRPDSISSFFNPSPNQPPHQHQQHHHHHPQQQQQQQQLFDHLSTYYDVFSRPPTNPHHHHHQHQQQQQQQQLSWAPPPPPPQQPISQGGGAAQPPNFLFNPPNMGTITTSPLTATSNAPVINNDQNVVRASTTGGSTSSYPPHQSLQDPGPNPATGSTRNPKKRSRASRRAPTTVLTTDTSNFRAMVQEFTGIPAPPFSSSASPLQFPHRTRLDLFGGGSSSSSTMPSYLLRPFAHKLNPPQTLPTFLSSTSSSSSSHHVDHSSNNNNIITSTSNSNSNYQQLSELGLLHKPQNVVLNMQSSSAGTATTTNASTSTTSILHDQDHHHRQQQQHPITMLSFQSLLQSQAVNSSKAPSNSSSHHCHDLPLFGGLKMGSVMEELGGVSSHGYHDEHHHQMGNLRGFNGSFGGGGGGGGSSSPSNATAVASTSQMVSSGGCKNVISSNSNFGGAPSDCHSKGSESTVPSRGEGIVDSWICPSD